MTYIPLKRDDSTQAALTVTYEHHELHEGNHYFIKEAVDQSVNNVYDVQWTTPNTIEWANFTFVLQSEAETEWYIYEGATISTAGTTLPAYNSNRNSANTSGMTIAGISNTSVANANADTDVSGATAIAHGVIGSGFQDGGFSERDNEIILKQNTIYCFRAIATAAGYIDFRIEWYEHADAFRSQDALSISNISSNTTVTDVTVAVV